MDSGLKRMIDIFDTLGMTNSDIELFSSELAELSEMDKMKIIIAGMKIAVDHGFMEDL